MNRLFLDTELKRSEVNEIPLRVLAHLGDAVFHLFEREREILQSANAKQMHNRVTMRVNAEKQAALLFQIAPRLNEAEQDVIRRARNLKAANYRRGEQTSYRQATAFESLVGYLYLTNTTRLQEVLSWTLEPAPEPSSDPEALPELQPEPENESNEDLKP